MVKGGFVLNLRALTSALKSAELTLSIMTSVLLDIAVENPLQN